MFTEINTKRGVGRPKGSKNGAPYVFDDPNWQRPYLRNVKKQFIQGEDNTKFMGAANQSVSPAQGS